MSQLKEDEYWKRCIKYKNSKAKENPRLNFDDGIKLNRAKKTSFGWDGFYKSEKGKAKVFEKTKVKWKEENERKWRECEKEAELTLVVWRESTSREELWRGRLSAQGKISMDFWLLYSLSFEKATLRTKIMYSRFRAEGSESN